MSRRKRDKNEVNDYEYRDGYRLVTDQEIEAVIRLYSEGRWNKNELRVYAGMQEHAVILQSSKVDLYRVVNSETKKRGIKRLSHKEIDAAASVIKETLPRDIGGQMKPVARKFLRYIAKGSASCSESILLMYYCHQRIRQPKRYERLLEKERFARFKYRELAEISGLRRATLSDGLKRLVNRGLINTVDVAKQNENIYGMLFVDGAVVSLTRKGTDNQPNRTRRKETATPAEEKRMTPREKTVTLINKDPKTTNCIGSRLRKKNELRLSLQKAMASPKKQLREVAERALMELDGKQSQAA